MKNACLSLSFCSFLSDSSAFLSHITFVYMCSHCLLPIHVYEWLEKVVLMRQGTSVFCQSLLSFSKVKPLCDKLNWKGCVMWKIWGKKHNQINQIKSIKIHTLCVHYAHVTANLNWEYLKYAKVARMHYFSTIALRTSHAMLTWAWALHRVDSRQHRVDLFATRGLLFCCVISTNILNLVKSLIYHIKKTKKCVYVLYELD